MKHKKILIIFMATILSATHCLEGMDRRSRLYKFFCCNLVRPVESSLTHFPDDCVYIIFGFLDTKDILCGFQLTSKENQNLVDVYWKNRSGKRWIEVINFSKESLLKFCKNHPHWPYSINLVSEKVDALNTLILTIKNIKKLYCNNSLITITNLNHILPDYENIEWLEIREPLPLKFELMNWPMLPKLKVLAIASKSLSAEALKKIILICKNLTKLDLGTDCGQIDWQNVDCLPFEKLKNLEINFHGKTITTKKLNQLLSPLQNIKELRLIGCITESWNKVKLNTFKNLKYLNISFTNIIAEDLNKILLYCKNLKAINISYCKKINWNNVNYSLFKNLEYANLCGTSIIHDGLDQMLSNNKNIDVCIYDCNISEEETKTLADKYSTCKIAEE